jgi:hypothetical protein
MSKRATMAETVQQKRRKTEEKSKFPHGDVLVTIMSFLKVVEKAFMKTVCKDFVEACECSDSCVGTLDLKGITDFKFKKTVLSMPKRTFVKKLNLSKLYFENETFFIGMILLGKFPKLQYLDLSCTNATDEALYCTVIVPLKSLNLSNCDKITDDVMKYSSQMYRLTELRLEGCLQITNAILPHLSRLPLETLSLPFEITDDDIPHLPVTLKEIPHFSSEIPQFSSEITDAGLVQLARLTSLHELDFRCCDLITDSGLRRLAHLKLTCLMLDDCNNVTDESMEYLSHMPLTWLHLSGCNITDRGLACLSRLRLTWLNLYGCSQITNAGIEYLSDMPLKHLNLRGCNLVTDVSMLVIRYMPLTYLDLQGCNITADTLMSYIPNMRLSILNVDTIQFFTTTIRMRFTQLTAPTYVDFGLEEDAPDDDAPDDDAPDDDAPDDKFDVDM